jgi:CO/xanthine dehydrogenase Mo-binding subunit
MSHARSQKWVFDQRWGLSLAKRFYSSMPPTILDIPLEMKWDAVNIPDPQTPTGIKGIGEPPVGAGAAAVLCAIADAIGDEHIRRTPLTPDTLITSLETGKASQALTAHI